MAFAVSSPVSPSHVSISIFFELASSTTMTTRPAFMRPTHALADIPMNDARPEAEAHDVREDGDEAKRW